MIGFNLLSRITFVIILFSFFSCSESLKSNEGQIEEVVSNFYSWYSDQIIWENNLAYQPDFIADSNNMAMLDFQVVDANLKELGFHDSYIKEYKNSFSDCSNNLKSIELDTLMNFDGIGKYEDIKCDFFNSYYWTQDMEPHDGVEVINVKMDDSGSATASCKIFNISEKMRIYWEHKKLTVKLVKLNGVWKIRYIDVELI